MDSNNVSGAARIGLKVTRTTLRLSVKLAGKAIGGAIKLAQARAASPQSSSAAPAPGRPAPAARPASSARPAPAASTPSTNGTQPPSAAAAPAAQAPPVPSTPAPAAPEAPAAPAAAAAATVPADLVPPDEQPDTPLTAEQAHAKTDDDEDEVVAEFAEAGAEDGAGAQLHLEEPWEGYDAANAETVNARISGAGAAELAMLELYEQSHKNRKTVLEAAQRRLKQLSPSSDA